MNHKKIQRIMRQYYLYTKIRKRNPYKDIMKKGLEHRTSPNILNREFSQVTPYRFLCTDITYMKFNHRFVYLSLVKDICSGEIVAWYINQHLHLPLVPIP
jgi:transposase InsO family protein